MWGDGEKELRPPFIGVPGVKLYLTRVENLQFGGKDKFATSTAFA